MCTEENKVGGIIRRVNYKEPNLPKNAGSTDVH